MFNDMLGRLEVLLFWCLYTVRKMDTPHPIFKHIRNLFLTEMSKKYKAIERNITQKNTLCTTALTTDRILGTFSKDEKDPSVFGYVYNSKIDAHDNSLIER